MAQIIRPKKENFKLYYLMEHIFPTSSCKFGQKAYDEGGEKRCRYS